MPVGRGLRAFKLFLNSRREKQDSRKHVQAQPEQPAIPQRVIGASVGLSTVKEIVPHGTDQPKDVRFVRFRRILSGCCELCSPPNDDLLLWRVSTQVSDGVMKLAIRDRGKLAAEAIRETV